MRKRLLSTKCTSPLESENYRDINKPPSLLSRTLSDTPQIHIQYPIFSYLYLSSQLLSLILSSLSHISSSPQSSFCLSSSPHLLLSSSPPLPLPQSSYSFHLLNQTLHLETQEPSSSSNVLVVRLRKRGGSREYRQGHWRSCGKFLKGSK